MDVDKAGSPDTPINIWLHCVPWCQFDLLVVQMTTNSFSFEWCSWVLGSDQHHCWSMLALLTPIGTTCSPSTKYSLLTMSVPSTYRPIGFNISMRSMWRLISTWFMNKLLLVMFLYYVSTTSQFEDVFTKGPPHISLNEFRNQVAWLIPAITMHLVPPGILPSVLPRDSPCVFLRTSPA
jgi:hypothetical protein